MKVTSIGIIIFTFTLIVSCVLATINTNNPFKDGENEKRCNSYCNHCSCMSFYCGEECICECNKHNNIEKDCITTVQNDAKKLKIPFEILIQGPNANEFLKDIEKHSYTSETKILKAGRGKRSTIVIYRPQNFFENERHIDPLSTIEMKINEARKEIEKREAENN